MNNVRSDPMQGPLKSSNQMQKQKPFLRPHKPTPTTTVKVLLRERHCRNLIRNRRRGVTNSSYKRYLLSKIKPQRNTEIITPPKATKTEILQRYNRKNKSRKTTKRPRTAASVAEKVDGEARGDLRASPVSMQREILFGSCRLVAGLSPFEDRT
ncbi:uncharacterized protein LOC133873599 [Alnus glutinosa]|uniref:uncharacterized protein LOC133873599 n=1 Tax=Alnus glutinosa TaxID=3517 RepID=UPI002D771868|nr:uncharacterized protein LOC133873599 [Alnus glutinosa]